MLFNSLHFLFFFIFITLLYFSVPRRTQWVLLLIASCYFYAAFIPAYLGILFVVILIDYVSALWIERTTGVARKVLLIASLASNIGILAFFKYYDFFAENLTALFSLAGSAQALPALDSLLPGIVLPIGLSFHTFQSMSYTIEVYRGNYPAERHLGIYSLYVLFYPQLVAGPIERPQNVLPQLHRTYTFDWERVRSGLMMMGWGLFKKVVIADRLALLVDPAYADVRHANGATLLVAVFFYAIQIYCDFSGYSDIAIGAGKVMGIKMMENFRTPYLSQSISEFWRRWHISLSTWFRDYLYIPLGGNRVSAARASLNLVVVFAVSGLWHGADWKFIIWGLLHGLYLVAGQLLSRYRSPVLNTAQQVYEQRGSLVGMRLNQVLTFTLVMLTWVFFRAANTGDALLVLRKVLTFSYADMIQTALQPAELAFCFLLIASLLVEARWMNFIRQIDNRSFWLIMPLLLFVCYLFGVFTANQFIYFQF
ncbi:MBOAT family O-acyltransferase [Spirosoma koreense]